MNYDSLADTLLTTEGQPAYPGMPFQHQLAPTVAHGFPAILFRHFRRKA